MQALQIVLNREATGGWVPALLLQAMVVVEFVSFTIDLLRLGFQFWVNLVDFLFLFLMLPVPVHYPWLQDFHHFYLLRTNADLISDLSRKPTLTSMTNSYTVMQFVSHRHFGSNPVLSNHRADRLRLPLNPPLSNLLFHQRLQTVFLAGRKLLHHFTAAYQNPAIYVLVPDDKQTLRKG